MWRRCLIFTRLEVYEPDDYTSSDRDLACERVKALKLKAQDKYPLSLTVLLSNKPESNMVYVNDINYDTYIICMNKQIKKKWKPTPLKSTRLVKLKLQVLRDGTIKNAIVDKSSGAAEFDKQALKTVQSAGRLSPLPDGSCQAVTVEFTLEYNCYNK